MRILPIDLDVTLWVKIKHNFLDLAGFARHWCASCEPRMSVSSFKLRRSDVYVRQTPSTRHGLI